MAARFQTQHAALLHSLVVCCALLWMSLPCQALTSFSEAFYVNDGGINVNVGPGGQPVQLVLTQAAGGGFSSFDTYLFGSFSMQIKVMPGNSAGTVTTFYMASTGSSHDEIDFEFLGNLSGQPYLLQTNLYANGVGNREVRHNLWFDPTAAFHTYTAIWTRGQIMFYVDSTLIRVFPNYEARGVPYPRLQPMGLYTSLWNGDTWATQQGRIKINWAAAPFVAYFQGFAIDACESKSPTPACASATNWWDQPQYQSLTAEQLSQLQSVANTYEVYNYCTDKVRYPTSAPECALPF